MVDIKLVENYRDDKQLRNMFNEFTEKIFSGLNFEKWYKSGYWTNRYIPHSLIKNNKIISNVSISQMDIIINDKPIRGIQIGTVGTLLEYRNQGLSKYLMELVLNKYNNSTELVFLFANDTVLDFYPKFGFQRAMESIYILKSLIPNSQYSTRKLNLNSIVDLKIIEELLNKRQMLTSIFGATDFQFITMWHLIYGFPKNIFYLEDEDIIIIYTINNNQMHIWDIIYSKKFDFSKVFPKFLAGNSVNSIYYYFPPDKVNFNYDEVIEDKKSIFFIKGNFPLKGKYFKFPITAQT